MRPCGPCMRVYMPHCCSHMAHVCPHIWPMYARMHAPLLLPCGPCMPPYMAHVCAHACPIAAPMWPMYAPIYGPCMSPLLLQNMAHSCLHIAYCSAHAWAITALVQIRYKAWRFNRFANCPNLCTTQWSIYARIYRPYIGAAMGHARIHGPYGSSNRACMRAYMAIYGGIHGPHGSSNGACMRAYMGHIWGHIWAT